MKLMTTLAAAALVAASATMAFAQASGGSSGSGAGGDPSVPRQNMTRPTPNSPPVNRRGDDMAPMQQSQVSNPMMHTKKKKHSMDRTYR